MLLPGNSFPTEPTFTSSIRFTVIAALVSVSP